MPFPLLALLPSLVAAGGAAAQAQGQKQASEAQQFQDYESRKLHIADALTRIIQNYGNVAQNRASGEADAIRTILRGF